jgi:deoxyadenosine/deoxycytidine kinase
MRGRNSKKVFVLVSGNIGCGKTTVADIIASVFGFRKFEESVEDNPYIKLFYEDMNKWCYKLQRYLLFTRVVAHERISMFPESAVQDRSIYEDMEVFAKNQVNNKLWTREEYEKYKTFCEIISKELIQPDLLIYLRTSVPVLKQRIEKRNRRYEQELIKEGNNYLEQLNQLYENWIKRYKGPKLIINTDNLNIVDNPHDLQRLINTIKSALKKETTLKKFVKK